MDLLERRHREQECKGTRCCNSVKHLGFGAFLSSLVMTQNFGWFSPSPWLPLLYLILLQHFQTSFSIAEFERGWEAPVEGKQHGRMTAGLMGITAQAHMQRSKVIYWDTRNNSPMVKGHELMRNAGSCSQQVPTSPWALLQSRREQRHTDYLAYGPLHSASSGLCWL